MDYENKVLSKEILSLLYDSGKSVGTAESCSSGQVAAVLTSVPGASNYFKGSVVSYADEVKIDVLGVDAEVIAEKTAVCEEVAVQMVKGAIKLLKLDYAVSVTGFAGPGGAPGVPVGTIWIAAGNADEQITTVITEDHGRDVNVANAVHSAMLLLLDFVRTHEPSPVGDEVVELTMEQ